MKCILYFLIFTFALTLHAQRTDFNEISFEKADKIAQRYKGEDLYSLPILTLRLTAQLETDVERFRAIYSWVCRNIKGDYNLTSENEHKRRKFKNSPEALALWNEQCKRQVFKRLREDKETLCTGYAFLVKDLANLAGIECEIVHGYGRMNGAKFADTAMANHSWNAVKLNGKWYLCDATWSSGIIDMNTYLFEFDFDDSFFLMHPQEFAKSHQPTEQQWTLLGPEQ